MSDAPPPPLPPPPPPRGFGRRVVEALLALLIVFEEWGWQPLERAVAQVMRAPGLAALERWIARLPPWAAVAVFGLPALLLLPVKLLALWAMTRGHAAIALAVLIGAKVVGTAIVARLYALTQPALLRLAWFASLHARWIAWKTPLIERVHASAPWRWARALRARLRATWRRRPPR